MLSNGALQVSKKDLCTAVALGHSISMKVEGWEMLSPMDSTVKVNWSQSLSIGDIHGKIRTLLFYSIINVVCKEICKVLRWLACQLHATHRLQNNCGSILVSLSDMLDMLAVNLVLVRKKGWYRLWAYGTLENNHELMFSSFSVHSRPKRLHSHLCVWGTH